jgi:hypothetical protein
MGSLGGCWGDTHSAHAKPSRSIGIADGPKRSTPHSLVVAISPLLSGVVLMSGAQFDGRITTLWFGAARTMWSSHTSSWMWT